MTQLPPHLAENPLNVLSLGFNPNQFNQLHFGLIEQFHAAALKIRAGRDLQSANSPVSPLTASDSPAHLASISLANQLANGNASIVSSLPLTSANLTSLATTNTTTTSPSAMKNSFSAFSVDALLGAAAKQSASILDKSAGNQSNNLLSNLPTNLSSCNSLNASLSSLSSSSSVESSANQNSSQNTKSKPNAKNRIKRLVRKEKGDKSTETQASSDRSRSNTPDRGDTRLKSGESKVEAKSEPKKSTQKKSAEKSKSSSQNSKTNVESSKMDSSFEANFDDDLLDEEDLEDEENLNVCDDSMDYDDVKANIKRNELVQQHLAHYPILNSMQRHMNASPSSLLSSTALYNPLNGQLPPSFYSNFFPGLPLNGTANGDQTTPSATANGNSSTTPATINGQSALAANYFAANGNWPSFLGGPPPLGSFPGLGLGNRKFGFVFLKFLSHFAIMLSLLTRKRSKFLHFINFFYPINFDGFAMHFHFDVR